MSKAPFSLKSSSTFTRTAALAASCCVMAASAFAQQAGVERTPAGPLPYGPTGRLAVASVTDGPLDASFTNLPVANLDLARTAGITYSSSASPALDAVDATAAASLDLPGVPEDATQPPPRRRYGRPRYNDNSHNADGSSKYAFIAGVGFTQPLGNTYHYLNPSYSFQVGAGRNFNKNFSIIAQFDWDNFGFNGRTLGNESAIYFNDTDADTGVDGSSHIWSFSLNPVYNIYSRDTFGAYVVAGVGFYHKVATFTIPQEELGYGNFGELEEFEVNAAFAHFTSNAPGFNGGIGFTYKPSRFSSQRLYGEVRYVFVDNSQRQGITVANESTTTYTGTNGYPANSNRTTYIPVKFGIRF